MSLVKSNKITSHQTYQHFYSPTMFPLTNEISCFKTNVNSLAMFNISNEDIKMLNRTIREILNKLHVKSNRFEEFEINEPHFFPCDVSTQYLNKKRTEDSFMANIVLRIDGMNHFCDYVKPKIIVHSVTFL